MQEREKIFKKNFDLCFVFFHSHKALQLVIALSKDKKPTNVLVKASSRFSKRERTVIGDSGQLVLVIIINSLKFEIDNVRQRYIYLILKKLFLRKFFFRHVMDQPQKAKFVAIAAPRGLSGQVGQLAVVIKTGAELDLVQSRYCLCF